MGQIYAEKLLYKANLVIFKICDNQQYQFNLRSIPFDSIPAESAKW
jgi:hypothetical protein